MTRTPSWDEASYSSRAGLSGAEGEAIHRLPATASAIEVAEVLGLEPHREGGFFRETYRSQTVVRTGSGPRPLATAIIYLLTAGSPSRFHRLRFEEIWFFHAGCRAELVLLESEEGGRPPAATGLAATVSGAPADPVGAPPLGGKDRRLQRHLLGAGRPQVFVPAGRWLGARVAPDGAAEDDPVGSGRDWTLVGCVVTPGFEYEDFELADREALLREFPQDAEIILALT